MAMSDDRDVWAGDGERYEGDDRPGRTVTSRRDLSLDDYQREATRTAVYPGHGEAWADGELYVFGHMVRGGWREDCSDGRVWGELMRMTGGERP